MQHIPDFCVLVCVQTDSALTVVENPEGEEGARGDEEEEVTVDEDVEVVQPTEQWQTLKQGNDALFTCLYIYCVDRFCLLLL